MNKYMIVDSVTLKLYGITNKRWISRLFVLQRSEYNKNLIIQRKKCTDESVDKTDDLYLHYFSGFALTNKELEFISYQSSIARYGHENKEILITSKIKKLLKYYNKEILPEYYENLVKRIIQNPAIVEEELAHKNFLSSINTC